MFFDFGLSFLEELRSLVVALGHVGDEFSGLESHVKLQMGNILAEVFSLEISLRGSLRKRNHGESPKNVD